jgi:hypothetical protein
MFHLIVIFVNFVMFDTNSAFAWCRVKSEPVSLVQIMPEDPIAPGSTDRSVLAPIDKPARSRG